MTSIGFGPGLAGSMTDIHRHSIRFAPSIWRRFELTSFTTKPGPQPPSIDGFRAYGSFYDGCTTTTQWLTTPRRICDLCVDHRLSSHGHSSAEKCSPSCM